MVNEQVGGISNDSHDYNQPYDLIKSRKVNQQHIINNIFACVSNTFIYIFSLYMNEIEFLCRKNKRDSSRAESVIFHVTFKSITLNQLFNVNKTQDNLSNAMCFGPIFFHLLGILLVYNFAVVYDINKNK